MQLCLQTLKFEGPSGQGSDTSCEWPQATRVRGSEGLKPQGWFSTSRRNTDVNSANKCCALGP